MKILFFLRCVTLGFLAVVMMTRLVSADSLTIDLTHEPRPSSELHLKQGSNRDPQGHVLTADGQSLLLDGKPWVAIVGEFHYARYPRAEWREELLKMKAGGCTTVSTYVFWIVHEEEQGQFDWSGQRSLRDFVLLCQEVGLKVSLRLGPWSHGEMRNGGFPDWVMNSGAQVRTNDPAFLDLVRPFYQQIAEQTQGLYWKDGGPIVAVQVDNESNQPDYLLSLKAMAQECGIDVPFYLMTGWSWGGKGSGVPIPKQELLPLFGGYAWGLWKKGPILDQFVFRLGRNNQEMGAAGGPATSPSNGAPAAPPVRTPYLCAENGGGMASSYAHRVFVQPDDISALNLIKLGDGNTMPGFYMYQGGIDPDGKLSTLNETSHGLYGTHNDMPIKDYDFQAPLGAWGEVRGQYHLLREQNLFLQDFGADLIRMSAFIPDVQPQNATDTGAIRWAVRWNDRSGFLFFDNYAPELPFPDHPGVQFTINTDQGTVQVPTEPITIPAGSYGVWPIQLLCHGVILRYATAQPICYSDQGKERWYFFAAISSIDPDFVFTAKGIGLARSTGDKEVTADTIRIHHLTAGTGEAFALAGEDGSLTHFVVLTPKQAEGLWRVPFAGRDRVILSTATVLADKDHLDLKVENGNNSSFSIVPPLPSVLINNIELTASPDGVFERFTPKIPVQPPLPQIVAENAGEGDPVDLPATDEEAWAHAAVWKLHIPPEARGRHILVQVHYVADAARLYSGDTLIDDNYFDSKPFDFGLWRIPEEQWSDLTLKIVPYSDKLLSHLPDSVGKDVAAIDPRVRNQVTITTVEETNIDVAPDLLSDKHP